MAAPRRCRNRTRARNLFARLREMQKKAKPTYVTEAVVDRQHYAYWICPNCEGPFEREYQAYCHNCGQALKWMSLRKIKYIYLEKNKKE